VTVEDHTLHGGLGGAVAEVLSDVMPTPLKRIGVQGFGESGDPKGSTPSTAWTPPASPRRQEVPGSLAVGESGAAP